MAQQQQQQTQQQQTLHAAGGNMYMGGGGMAAIGGMHQMHQRLGYPRTNNQRPPNVSVGPTDNIGNSIAGRGPQQEWRHLLMQQQNFQAQMRPQFNQQGHQGILAHHQKQTTIPITEGFDNSKLFLNIINPQRITFMSLIPLRSIYF